MAPKSKLTVEMSGEDLDLLRKMKRIEAKQKEMEAGFRKTSAETRKAGQSAADAFDGGRIERYAALLTGAGGVLTAVKAISAEWQNVIERQQRANQTQVTLAQAQQSVIRNLAGSSREEIQASLKAFSDIAAETNVDERFIAQAGAEAISASGGNRKAAEAAVRAAARFIPDSPEAIPGIAGSILDLQKVTGSDDASVNLGLLLKVGQMSRVVDPQQQAQNIPRSLIGQTAFGSTAQGAAALFSAISVGSGDIRGATSGTASIALAEQLQTFFGDKKVARKFDPSDIDTTSERIRALQGDQKLSTKFLDKASFEKVALGPIRQLLTDRQSEVARLFDQNLTGLPDQAGLRGVAEGAIANRGLSEFESNAARGRVLRSGQQRLQKGGDAEAAAIREELFTALSDSGTSAIKNFVNRKVFDAQVATGSDPSDIASDFLRGRARQLRLGGGGKVTAGDRDQAAILLDIAEKLERLNKTTEANATPNPTLAKPDQE